MPSHSTQAIVQALLDLLKKRRFSDITITEITKTAQVSRLTYYRHFEQKEDIISLYYEEMFRELLRLFDVRHTEKRRLYEVIAFTLAYFHTQRNTLDLLIKNNLTYLMLARFSDYIRLFLQHADLEHALSQTQMGFISGGLYAVMVAETRQPDFNADQATQEILAIIK